MDLYVLARKDVFHMSLSVKEQVASRLHNMNSQKIQGPGTAIKFWGVIWSGTTCIVPEAVIKYKPIQLLSMQKRYKPL